MEYEGRAQLGDDSHALEVVVRIPDVERPEWFGYVIECLELPRGEVTITLLDGGLYNAWRGTALVRDRPALPVLVGMVPLEPPVGA